MLRFNLIITLLAAAFIFTSCGEQKPAKTEEQYIQEANQKRDEKKNEEAIKEYRDFLAAYPQSSQAIYAYNQIAGIYFQELKDYQKSIDTYRELAEKHPNTKEAKQSLFMVAFIYDETMKDKEKAKDAYRKFLDKYPQDTNPDDKMSESARTMLQVLESGMTPEEMIMKNLNNESNTAGTKDTTAVKNNKTQGETPKLVPQEKKDNPNKDPQRREDKKDKKD